MILDLFVIAVVVPVASNSDNFSHETDSESVNSRESAARNTTPKMKYSDCEVESGMMGQQIMTRMMNGQFSVGTLPLTGEQAAMYGGQMISPTHPQGPLQFIPSQVHLLFSFCCWLEWHRHS